MGLVPERGLGYAVLMNADTGLGRGGMSAVAGGVHGLLMGREVAPSPSGAGPRAVVYGLLAVIVAVQLAATAVSLRTLRRWRAAPERRPRGRWATARAVGLPLLLNGGWAAFVPLALLPALGGPVAVVVQQVPDLGYVLLGSAALAAAWAAVRSVLALALLARAAPTGAPPEPRLASRPA
jgi:hypothetical protein